MIALDVLIIWSCLSAIAIATDTVFMYPQPLGARRRRCP